MCRPGAPVGSESVCFELLGFDILLDRKLRPWLLEVSKLTLEFNFYRRLHCGLLQLNVLLRSLPVFCLLLLSFL